MRHRDADLATDRRPGGAGVAPHEITILISDLLNLQGVTHHPPHLLPHLAGVTHVRTLVTPVWTILEISIKLTLPLSGVIQKIQKTNKLLLFFIYCLKKKCTCLFSFIIKLELEQQKEIERSHFLVNLIRITG